MVAAGSLRAEEAQGGVEGTLEGRAAVASETGFHTEAGQWEGERYLSEPQNTRGQQESISWGPFCGSDLILARWVSTNTEV